jgi:hypothetical protein
MYVVKILCLCEEKINWNNMWTLILKLSSNKSPNISISIPKFVQVSINMSINLPTFTQEAQEVGWGGRMQKRGKK